MKGEPIELNGQMVYFVPFRTGPSDRPKREAYYKMVEAFDAHDNAPSGTTVERYKELYEGVCAAIGEFAYQMLVGNYEEAEARALAGDVPVGWAAALGTLARTGALPTDFTTARAAGQKSEKPSGN